ncbi:hypothetical protein ACQKEF_24980 [Pseudomonas oryzihabitans]|uniref:hypothetical protein n=1 Tax=Pseudomonas oryzihabitans TaxID=47885 RepID=UPI003CFF5AEE
MRIAIVALEGSLLSAIAGLSDLFWMTNQTLRSPPLELPQSPGHAARPEFETVVVSADGNSLRDPQGRLISVDASFRDVEVCDAVLVTGMALAADRAPPLTKSVMQASDWISACHQKGRGLVGPVPVRSYSAKLASLIDADAPQHGGSTTFSNGGFLGLYLCGGPRWNRTTR